MLVVFGCGDVIVGVLDFYFFVVSLVIWIVIWKLFLGFVGYIKGFEWFVFNEVFVNIFIFDN